MAASIGAGASAGVATPSSGDLPVWSPDGKQIAYVAPSLLALPSSQNAPDRNFDVFVTSNATKTSRRVAAIGRSEIAAELRWAGSRRLILSDGPGGSLRRIDLTTGRVVDLGANPLSLGAGDTFAVSADGGRIAYTADSPYRTENMTSEGRIPDVFAVGVVSTSGGFARLLPQPKHASDAYPSFSPDGKEVVFARTLLEHGLPVGFGPPSLMLESVSGGDARPLNVRGDEPVWSPNGRWIAYQRFIRGASIGQLAPWTLDIVSPAGGKPRILLPPRIDETLALSWSPDSTRIAFITQSGVMGTATLVGRVTVFKLPSSLSLTFGDPVAAPQWSPSGKTLLFTAKPGARLQTDIYTIDADGRGLRPVR